MSNAIKKAIFIPAKEEILFSGSPDRNGFNELFKTYPLSFAHYSSKTYEYWIGFILTYLKNQGYEIILYNLEPTNRVIAFLEILEEQQIVKTYNVIINDALDLQRLILQNNYRTIESTFISDDVNLLEQCLVLFPENRLPEFAEENEKDKLLNYGLWNKNNVIGVFSGVMTMDTPTYLYNAENDLSVLLPDLVF